MTYDVIIIGAGPAGCKVGEIVAKNGYDVLILEEHPSIGIPTQCTGLVSHRIGKIPKDVIINKIKKARFHSKDSYFEIKSKEPVYLIDREKYDKHRAKVAEDAGVEIKLNTRFLKFEDDKVVTDKKCYRTKLLVGADGPNSTVAKVSNIELPNNLLYAVQVCAKSNFDPTTAELWFGSDIAPGLFAWVVPENEYIARVGLMSNKNPNNYLEKFLKRRFGDAKADNRIGDIIRYGLIDKSVSDGVLLVGDAACMVKPFSAGGLVYGQIGAGYAGSACVLALKANNFSEKFLLENYDKKWKKKLASPIKQGLTIKKIFSHIGDKSLIFKLIKNLGITKLSSMLDMDFLRNEQCT
jgi:geranylgeranyl reductase family protein